MVDSPVLSPSPSVLRNRLLTRTDSMRFFSSRGVMSFAYGFTLASILFMLFFVLNPSSYQQLSPRLRNAFQSSRGSHFSNVFAHIFPNSPSSSHDSFHHPSSNSREEFSDHRLGSASSPSQISRKEGSGLIPKDSQSEEHRIQAPQQEPSLTAWSPSPTASPNEQQDWMDMWKNCDMYEGSWVRDDSYPLYNAGSCPYIDEPFNCFRNGKRENMYEKYRWQPKNCNVPRYFLMSSITLSMYRKQCKGEILWYPQKFKGFDKAIEKLSPLMCPNSFNYWSKTFIPKLFSKFLRFKANEMLEMLRGKRLVFVGDSLNRNMWESLVCVLRNSVKDKSRLFEASGREEFRTEGSYSFIFQDYNCSVEFFRSVFLVQEWEIPDQKGSTKETLRLDLLERSCDKYKDADVLIFNTGHWWTHEKRIEGKGYYQEGDHIYGQMNVEEAFHKALLTWAQWIDSNVDPKKTTVFFRGYSPSHFRGGEWNSGGKCDNETEPMESESDLETPEMMMTIDSVIKKMKTPVFYLNITKMTYFRRDAHPSLFRNENMTEETKRYMLSHQDCSHWCLPGVPDLWNELVYAHLLYNLNRNKNNPPK